MEIEENVLNWWQKGVVYQICIKSFKDSNGDGIGDLKGITEKIDYFKLIGVDIIAINPFYLHGGLDNGYDVISFNQIDPVFGTMDDFEELVDKLHKNGI
jgi:glycosidase